MKTKSPTRALRTTSRQVHDHVARSYRSDHEIISAKTQAALLALEAVWEAWPDPARVVDLGVGDGDLLQELRRRCPKALTPTGVDISPAMLALARQRLPDLHTIEVSATEASSRLPAASFDAAFAHFILAYVPLPDVLREAARVLAPGGVLSLATSTNVIAGPFLAQIDRLSRSFNPLNRQAVRMARRGLHRTNTPDSYEHMLPAFAAAGFEVIDRRPLDFPVRLEGPDDGYQFTIKDGWCANVLIHPILPPSATAWLARRGLRLIRYPYVAEHRVEVCLLRKTG